MKFKTLLLIFLTSLIGLSLKAQFSIDGQYLARAEYRDGYKKLLATGTTPAFFVSQRTRVTFKYETEKLKFVFTPQDVRVWGDEQLTSTTGVYGDYASLDLFEGYAEIKAGSAAWISVGRQQLVYDNEWLLAARNWNQNGISYDALLVKMKFGDWNLHLAGSWNSQEEATYDNLYDPTYIKTLDFAWLSRSFGDKLSLSVIDIASGFTETDSTNTLHFRQTTGIYATFKAGNLKSTANAYYQYGKNQSGTKVSAALFDVNVGYKLGKFTPGIEASYLSGNKTVGGDTDHLFNMLYGARHKYFGGMDYFSNFVTGKDTKDGGLIDINAYLKADFSSKWSLLNTAHYFMLAQTNSSTPADRGLAFENDLVVKYKVLDYLNIEAGYAFLIPTSALETLQKVSDPKKVQQFAYLQLTVTPKIFEKKLVETTPNN